MLKRKLAMAPILTLALVLAAAPWGFGQGHIPDPDTGAKIKAATQAITLHEARIGYDLNHGGYYIRNNPRYKFGDKVILNQNHKVLKKLARSGKAVTVRGRVDPLNLLATHIFIESINGRRYQGRHAPLVRP